MAVVTDEMLDSLLDPRPRNGLEQLIRKVREEEEP